MDRTELGRNIKNAGAIKAFQDVICRGVNRFAFYKVLKGVKLDQVDPEFLECDPRFQSRFLTEATLREYSKNPEAELPKPFLDRALAKGDECYGFFDGDALVSYGWYSHKPTEMKRPDLGRFHPPGRLLIHFD